jgi:hypothetical protein
MKLVFVILCLSLGLFGVRSFGADVAGEGPGRKGGGSTEAGSPECKDGGVCVKNMHNSALDLPIGRETLPQQIPGDSPASKAEGGKPVDTKAAD